MTAMQVCSAYDFLMQNYHVGSLVGEPSLYSLVTGRMVIGFVCLVSVAVHTL